MQLNDQERHELRGMLVHYLKLTPGAAAGRVAELEAKSAAETTALLQTMRALEDDLRASIEREIAAVLNPTATAATDN
jgi:hypothetical protein